MPRVHPNLKTCRPFFALLAIVCLSLSGCSGAQPPVNKPAQSGSYQQGPASRDGTGKFYLSREISEVMGHRGAGWLERAGRESEERTDLLIDGLPLRDDSIVADIGAGTGYFSIEIAQRVPGGRVYAVDIQREMLDIIAARQRESTLTNIVPVLGSIDDPKLPERTIDLALIVDAYHEFSHPLEMGRAIVEALKPGGLLVLIEYRQEDPAVAIKPLHKMSEAQVKREMKDIGLEWLRTEDFLPQQHFLVFQRPLSAAL